MINYISKVFSIYFLLLAFIPCSDVCSSNTCLQGDGIHIEASSEIEHTDICTPLCVCLCCNTVVSVSEKFIFQNFKVHIKLNSSEDLHFSHNFLDPGSPPPKS
ncbi:MAG: hypothetical protein M3R36_01270 [Bacteroidota bacterium]|nr:hypothetical protein [Bacteroidota bacterium]